MHFRCAYRRLDDGRITLLANDSRDYFKSSDLPVPIQNDIEALNYRDENLDHNTA
jgi:hypothetical protein